MSNIVITGASKGIGREIADELKGNNLFLVASSLSSFKDIKGKNIRLFEADLSDSFSINKLVKEIELSTGRVDALINNAGVFISKPFETVSEKELDEQIDVNFKAMYLLCKGLLPLLEKGKEPHIINISSIAALKPSKGTVIYGAVKAGVTGLSIGLRDELNPRSIRVSVIHPYGVNTWNDPHPEKLLKPSDIARLVKFILESDPNCQIDEVTVSSLNRR